MYTFSLLRLYTLTVPFSFLMISMHFQTVAYTEIKYNLFLYNLWNLLPQQSVITSKLSSHRDVGIFFILFFWEGVFKHKVTTFASLPSKSFFGKLVTLLRSNYFS